MKYRTSETDPLQIAEVPVGSGRLGLTFCPGKQSTSMYGAPWKRDLDRDLEIVRIWGASHLVTLMEQHELERFKTPDLGGAVEARGIRWHHLPIVDVSVPGDGFLDHWPPLSRTLRDCLAGGGRVLVHCLGGLGRTGLLAALILVDHGVPAKDAVDTVRKARPGAIETREQEAYVLKYPDG